MAEALKAPAFADLYAQLQALPDHLIGEIIAGDVVVSPRPTIRHTTAGSVANQEIGFRFHRKPGGPERPGGWWILAEPELHLGGEVFVPDIAGWKRETLPELPDTAAIDLAPDWVCEVLSPRTERFDRRDKAESYGRAGVRWMWLINPQTCILEVYRREGAFWVRLGVYGGEESVRAEPFDAVVLELSAWWEGFKQS